VESALIGSSGEEARRDFPAAPRRTPPHPDAFHATETQSDTDIDTSTDCRGDRSNTARSSRGTPTAAVEIGVSPAPRRAATLGMAGAVASGNNAEREHRRAGTPPSGTSAGRASA